LSPKLTRQIFELIEVLHEQGTTVLLVEQNIHMALKLCDRGYVIQNGHVILSGTGEELLADEDVCKAYLGQRGSRIG
jgi:branched-chain amino acid transport system ATP-binding protein